jgi:ribosomal protein S12 methylthiotransferase
MIQLPKTAVITLGCPKNQVDAEQLLSLLARDGFPLVGQVDEAETIIVNTCAFIQPAVEESLDTILEIARHKQNGHCRHLVVMGCLPQRYGQELLKQIPEIDLALGTSAFPKLPELLLKFLHGKSPARLHVSPPDYQNTCGLPQTTSQPHTAYLKIAEGCDNHCSYCIIPQLKGKQASFPLTELARKASELAAAGVKELNIIAQDITAYGQKLVGRPDLVQLLERLNEIDGLEWIRLLYAYPGKISNELINLLGEQTKICPYLDLPIQHISDPVLKHMNRHDRSQTIRETIYKLGSLKRNIHLRSTVIVGFPGETDHDFQLLLDFIGEGHFTYLGCFPYWPETGTKAAMLETQIEEPVKEERCRAIMDCQRQVTSRHLQEYIGKSIPLLMEGESLESEFLLQARTAFQAPDIDGITYVTEGFAQPGEMAIGIINQVHEYDLFAALNLSSTQTST